MNDTIYDLSDPTVCDFCSRYITEVTDDPKTDDGHWLEGTGVYIESDRVWCCHQCLPEKYPKEEDTP